MKTWIPICFTVLVLPGCANFGEFRVAKRMEAVEIFRGDVDEAKFPAWPACGVPTQGATASAKFYGSSIEDTRTNSDSITRAFQSIFTPKTAPVLEFAGLQPVYSSCNRVI